MKIQELLTLAKDQQVQNVDLKYVSLLGRWHHISIPVDGFTSSLFEKGIGFDGSSIPGYSREDGSDMALIPDPTTAILDPFWDQPTLSLICDIYTGKGQPFVRDPRGIAKRAETFLKDSEFADEILMSPEFEFYIFDSVRSKTEINQSYYRIESSEAEWNSDRSSGSGARMSLKGGYHVLPPQDQFFKLRNRMSQLLLQMGIPVKYHHHEGGGAGQSEIEILFQPLLMAADSTMKAKYAIRMAAAEAEKTATFMPKPLWNAAGNGMHVHQHLFFKGKPLFWDEKGWAQLSDMALYYIGGLLFHGPALAGLTNPSTNSFKRLVPGFEAPIHLIYGLANRSAAVRIPEAGQTPQTKRIEFRPPDGTCNIYLAMAAMLLAGIDGIKRKIDPREHHFGPFDQRLTELTKTKQQKVKTLPLSLKEALEALEQDHEFLLEGGVFHEETLIEWIKLKKMEHADVRTRPHPREIALYFDA